MSLTKPLARFCLNTSCCNSPEFVDLCPSCQQLAHDHGVAPTANSFTVNGRYGFDRSDYLPLPESLFPATEGPGASLSFDPNGPLPVPNVTEQIVRERRDEMGLAELARRRRARGGCGG